MVCGPNQRTRYNAASIATNEQRLVEFDRELQKLSVLPSAATNEVPAFTPDLPTQPKP